MDTLKKMFGMTREEREYKDSKEEFRKPSWFDESETDDELFDNHREFMFQVFTNPLELQKHFDRQMQELLKSLKQYEDDMETFDESPREKYLKPGFEERFREEFKKRSNSLDTDLDGEIYADQLHSLLQRLSPELRSILPQNGSKKPKVVNPKPKLTDEEIIMGKIHGTIVDDEKASPTKRRDMIAPKLPPHFGGVFEGTYQGPKMFGQSVMTQTVRKPDGSYETKRVVRDSDGNIKTTITRTVDGKTETVTSYGNGTEAAPAPAPSGLKSISSGLCAQDCNIFVSKHGYALPKNMW